MPNWKKVVVSGSDAALNNITATGDVTVQGDLIAENYVVSSSVYYNTQSFSSGSTIFGDTNDDTHQFTGSLFISGNLTLESGSVTVEGVSLTGITSSYISSSLAGNVITYNQVDGNTHAIDLSSVLDNTADTDWYINTGLGYISTSLDVLISGTLDVSESINAVDLILSGDGSPEIIADGGPLILSSSTSVIVSASSLSVDGLLFASLSLDNTSNNGVVHYNPTNDELFYTDDRFYFSNIDIGSGTPTSTVTADNIGDTLVLTTGSNNIVITSILDFIDFDLGKDIIVDTLTANVNISSSGLLFTSASDASGEPYFNLLIDTSSGRLYYSASVAGGQDYDWELGTGGQGSYYFNPTSSTGDTNKIVVASGSVITNYPKLLNIIGKDNSTDLLANIGDTSVYNGLWLYNNDTAGGVNDKYVNIDFGVGTNYGRIAFSQTTGAQGNFSIITNDDGTKRETLKIKGSGDITVTGSISASLPINNSPLLPLVAYDESSGGLYKYNLSKNRNLFWKATTGNPTSYNDLTGSGITLNEGEIFFATQSIGGKYYAVLSYKDQNGTIISDTPYWTQNNIGAYITFTETSSGAFVTSRLSPDSNPESYSPGGVIRYIMDIGFQYDSTSVIGSGFRSSSTLPEPSFSSEGGEMLQINLEKVAASKTSYTPDVSLQESFYGVNGILTPSEYNYIDLFVTESTGGIGDPATSIGGGSSFDLKDKEYAFIPAIATSTNLKINSITASADISASGNLFAGLPEDTNGDYNNTVVFDTATGQFYYTGSYSSGNVNNTGAPADNQVAIWTDATTIEGDSGFTYTGTVLSIQANTHNLDGGVVSVNDKIYLDGINGNITASGDISASGNLLAGLPEDTNGDYNNTVVFDTATGQFYYTGSYGGGGGGGNAWDTIQIGDGSSYTNLTAGVGETLQINTGSNISITNITNGSGTDSFDINAIPAGSNNEIQFNNNGVFGSDSQFIYSPTNNAMLIADPTETDNIGLSHNASRPHLITSVGSHFFFSERVGTINNFAVFDRLNRYFSVQPIQTQATNVHIPSSRLHVLDLPADNNHVIKSINQNNKGTYNLLLGTAATDATLSQHKFIAFHVGSGNDGGTELNGGAYFDPSGVLGGGQASANTVLFYGLFSSPSDKKLKKHITFTKKSIDDIMSFKVKDFRWKKEDKTTNKTTGLIAQDLVESHPYLVRELEGTLSVDYQSIIPLLIKAVQDQQEQINELKEQLKNK